MVGTLREINLSNQRNYDGMFSLRTEVLYRFANSSRMSCLISIFLIKHPVEDSTSFTNWKIVYVNSRKVENVIKSCISAKLSTAECVSNLLVHIHAHLSEDLYTV